MFAAFKVESSTEKWYIDSGATNHMTAKQEHFKNFCMYPGEIKAANNNTMQAVGKGDIEMKLATHRGNEIVTVKDVLYLSDLEVNLLSIRKIVDHQNSVVFDRSGSRIINSSQEVIEMAKQVNGLYKLNVHSTESAYVASENSTELGIVD
ncbi:uncharacterized protein [Musca autumnalis]|uniref:uncharacterized protein n=1 Tax=Musca autumnalis TaxID=221902 RepID=UPI003CF9993A